MYVYMREIQAPRDMCVYMCSKRRVQGFYIQKHEFKRHIHVYMHEERLGNIFRGL